MNVKLNDNVLVIAGKYKGKQGKVVATSPKNATVIVEGVNIHKKAKKARKANEVSKIIDMEAPIDVSNVMVVCPSCGKAIRVKHAEIDGKKVRVCGAKKSDGTVCGAVLDKAFAGKNAKNAKKKEEAPKKRVRKRAKKEDAETAESGDKAE